MGLLKQPLKQKTSPETAPLLAHDGSASTDTGMSSSPAAAAAVPPPKTTLLSSYRRVLIVTFFLSVSFVFTATPLMFAFRTMECEEYYLDHDVPPGAADRCANRDIEARTASMIGLVVLVTSFSGFLNLLVTTWQIRRWGVRFALINQTAWPVLRNLCQIVAVKHGFRFGTRLIMGTQLITILGGGAGYMLAVNNYVADLVSADERTGAFGVLSGVAMAGTAFGFTAGGLAGDYISAVAPFEITFCLLVGSTLFTGLFLPYIAPAPRPDASVDGKPAARGGPLSCLAVFVPRRIEGHKGRYWGLTLLGLGAFMGVLATAFVPLMLQLTATNRFAFTPSQNGYLMSLNSSARAAFLTLAFPRVIARGRAWFTPPAAAGAVAAEAPAAEPSTASSPTPTLVNGGLPTDAQAFEPASALLAQGQEAEEPVDVRKVMAPADAAHGSAFDLAFLKWSMVLDACLTGAVGFNTRPEEILAAALILPLASGTAPACKGVMMELVPASERADALSAISLIETAGYILTGSLFGVVFSWLSDIGKPNLVFFVNASLALFGGLVLMAVRFPRPAQPASAA